MAKVEGAKKEAGRVGSRFVTPEQAWLVFNYVSFFHTHPLITFPSSNSSSLQNVLGYFQDYIPQVINNHPLVNSFSIILKPYSTNSSKTDIVLWARFETADCNGQFFLLSLFTIKKFQTSLWTMIRAS